MVERGLAKIIAVFLGESGWRGRGQHSTSKFLTTFFYVTLAYILVSSNRQVS